MNPCCSTHGCDPADFSLERLLRHAQRFGPDSVYETAVEHRADASLLGKLAEGIRNMPGRWELTRDQQTALARRLFNVGADEGLIRKYSGMSRKSVQTLIHGPETPCRARLAAPSRNTHRS